jgi:hypothetical protein
MFSKHVKFGLFLIVVFSLFLVGCSGFGRTNNDPNVFIYSGPGNYGIHNGQTYLLGDYSLKYVSADGNFTWSLLDQKLVDFKLCDSKDFSGFYYDNVPYVLYAKLYSFLDNSHCSVLILDKVSLSDGDIRLNPLQALKYGDYLILFYPGGFHTDGWGIPNAVTVYDLSSNISVIYDAYSATEITIGDELFIVAHFDPDLLILSNANNFS